MLHQDRFAKITWFTTNGKCRLGMLGSLGSPALRQLRPRWFLLWGCIPPALLPIALLESFRLHCKERAPPFRSHYSSSTNFHVASRLLFQLGYRIFPPTLQNLAGLDCEGKRCPMLCYAKASLARVGRESCRLAEWIDSHLRASATDIG